MNHPPRSKSREPERQSTLSGRRSAVHRFFSLITLIVGFACVWPDSATAQMRPASPARLRLRVERPTVLQGEATPIVLGFLDRQYRPTVNDFPREITFGMEPVDPKRRGAGIVRPMRLIVPAGAGMSRDARFEAHGPGRVVIHADSPGLEGSRTLIIIVARPASLFERLLGLPVYAQAPIQVDIYPPQFAQPLPANSKTPAQFFVNLSRDLETGEKLRIRVSTFPGARVVYEDKEWPGSVDIAIGEGNARSDEFRVSSSSPGNVHVTARVLPGGPEAAAEIPFALPAPHKIVFERDREEISSDQRELSLLVQLVDQSSVPLERLDRDYRIQLRCLDHADLVRLEPSDLRLTPQQPSAQPRLYVKGIPRSRQLKLEASDVEQRLWRGQMQLSISLASTSTLALVVFSGLGGLLGALARQFYREGVKYILPRRMPDDGRLALGLIGHALFGGFFGIVVFLALRLGLLGPLGLPDKLESVGGMKAVAFLFGVFGGFAGVVALAKLAGRWFPEGKQTVPSAGGDA